MTAFFPDLNVWLALSDRAHPHSAAAWNWLDSLPSDALMILCRYTQIGLLRLLANRTVMGTAVLTLGGAWRVYERWLEDPRVQLFPEPAGLDAAFRHATKPHDGSAAAKWVGDCYLLAYAKQCQAALVTFDKALLALSRRTGHPAIPPA